MGGIYWKKRQAGKQRVGDLITSKESDEERKKDGWLVCLLGGGSRERVRITVHIPFVFDK